jgi:hypothetical protein
MILNYMRFPDDGVDVLQMTLDWAHPLEREPFEAAWHLVARRHEALRTVFRLDERDGLVQGPDPAGPIDIRWRDLPQPPAIGPDHPFDSFLRADRRERFDLTRRPPVRLTILRRAGPGGRAGERGTGAPAHRAVLTFHHALLDGRSMRLLVEEVSAAYGANRDGRAAPEPPRPSFHEFVRWWQTADPSASERFWAEYLAGTVLPRPLPGYLGEPVAGTAVPMKAETVLSRPGSELVRQAASAAGLSSSTMVSAAWALLRARYGGVTDVVLAVARSCRRNSIPGAEDIIGLLFNTVPLRVRFNEEWSVRELVTAVHDSIRRIREHQRTPMGSALAWAGLPADTALVDSLLMFDRRRLGTALPGGDAVPSSAWVDRLPSYPLMLCAYDEPQIHLSFYWDRCCFADGSARQMLDQLHGTLIELASNLAEPVAGLDPGRRLPRSAVAPRSIGRRDRNAYRLPAPRSAPDGASSLAPHLVRLTGDWALWRTVCLRGAGFPVHLLAALGDAGLARAADATLAADAATPGMAASDPAALDRATAAYAAEFIAAVHRLSAALHGAASLPPLREAVAWQNRHALTTGIDALVRRGPRPSKRNTQHRQHEALVASYVQRYCAKNDTIGFFGPVGWSRIDDGRGIRIAHAGPEFSLSARATYLEGWAVQAIMADHGSALRPWLVPRRIPSFGVDGSLLRLPLTPPVALTQAEAAVMQACDGTRDASEIAAALAADPSAGFGDVAEVFALMARLADSRRLAWQVEAAPQDPRAERSMKELLSRVTDDGVRGPAEKALGELTAARDELAGAAGDADRVATAMAGLEATFTRLAGVPPTRRAGELYGGRTLAYEECLRGDTVRLGADVLDGLREPLALVLDSARWFITACGALYERRFEDAYRQRAGELGTDIVPFVDAWMLLSDVLADPPRLIEPVMSALRQRWSAILDPPPGARRVRLRAADLRERVASAFPAQPLPWPMAVHHSPDLLLAAADAAGGGRLTWVLGEVHPSIVTMRYATWQEFHDTMDTDRAAMRHDVGGAKVWLAETGEMGGTHTRLCNVLSSPGDLRFVFARDSCGYDPRATVTPGECDLVRSFAGLRVRRRDGTFERGLLEVVGDLIGTTASNCFDLVPPGTHVPRVAIDDLVVSRETWRLAATDPTFADTANESTRYLQARAWAASHGLPQHVFCRFTGESKPIYADLTSLASVDLISRSLRRARRKAGADASVTVVEMLPPPDEAWLTDGRGQRYTAELRMVAVDQKMSARRQEG